MSESSHEAKLAQKLHSVMKTVEYLQKDGQNSFHGYKYASEAAIKRSYRDAMLKSGIAFGMDVVDVQERDVIRKTKGGDKPHSLATVKIACTFTDTETGFSVTRTGFGNGLDDSDKAIYKGITGALKYVITGNFLTPTGEDPEVPTEVDEQSAKDAEEAKNAKRSPSKSPDEVTLAARAKWSEVRERCGVAEKVLELSMMDALQVEDIQQAQKDAILATLNGIISKYSPEDGARRIMDRAMNRFRGLQLMSQIVLVSEKIGKDSGGTGAVQAFLKRNVADCKSGIPFESAEASEVLGLIFEKMSDEEAKNYIKGQEEKAA